MCFCVLPVFSFSFCLQGLYIILSFMLIPVLVFCRYPSPPAASAAYGQPLQPPYNSMASPAPQPTQPPTNQMSAMNLGNYGEFAIDSFSAFQRKRRCPHQAVFPHRAAQGPIHSPPPQASSAAQQPFQASPPPVMGQPPMPPGPQSPLMTPPQSPPVAGQPSTLMAGPPMAGMGRPFPGPPPPGPGGFQQPGPGAAGPPGYPQHAGKCDSFLKRMSQLFET